jgi:hypothetical protein
VSSIIRGRAKIGRGLISTLVVQVKALGLEVHDRHLLFFGNSFHRLGVRSERRPGLAILKRAAGYRRYQNWHAADGPSIVDVLAKVILKISIGIGRTITLPGWSLWPN